MATLKGPGRLPLPKNLINKSPEELLRTLGRFGMQVDVESIRTQALASYNKRLAGVIKEGVLPDEATMEAIATQHQKDISSGLRSLTKQAIREYRLGKAGGGLLLWLDVGDEVECKSCKRRHGKIKSAAEWRKAGLPGSSALICNKNCRCELIPAE